MLVGPLASWLAQILTTTSGPQGLWGETEGQGGRSVDHPGQAGQAGGEDHIMERNLGSPLISPRGLAADHCMSRLWPLQFLPVEQDEDNEDVVLRAMFVCLVDHNE